MNSRTVLVTGSSSGIGAGIAKVFLKNGYKVILHGAEDQSSITPSLNELNRIGEVLSYYQVDINNPDAIEQFCNELNASKTTIDILVNNAGIQHVSPIQDFDPQMWDKIIAINLSASFHLIRKLITNMQAQKWGRIINIASAHGLVASVNKAAYVASKHALVGLTKVVALENAKNGITCNAVCPGWVHTPLVEAQIQKIAIEQNIPYELAKSNLLKEKQPSGEFATANDIGEFVAFLCGNSATQINGATLSMDGGWVAQ